ncbi:hypothetical protein S40288_05584 [Stachybotrys chartarum IBT 40288]|nr:hypothetical protein S40288_05584 [Stachybotrys chartarum IBT 40288]
MDKHAIASILSVTLDLPPSCIQFCPAHPDYFVVGTYNLEQDEHTEDGTSKQDEGETTGSKRKPQSRNGSLLVFQVNGKGLSHVQTVLQPSAILDIRFHPVTAYGDILAVVSSTGSLAVFKIDPNRDADAPLYHLKTSRYEETSDDVLFLQCAWHPCLPRLIAVSTSNGSALLLRLSSEWEIEMEASRDLPVGNTLEAWSIAFSPGQPTPSEQRGPILVYCGGDDSSLSYASCSVNDSEDSPSQAEEPFAPVVLRREHEAGVTAILPLFKFGEEGSRVVITGSYDEHMRVFLIHDLHDSYGAKHVQQVADIQLGGGVWRLDLIDCRSSNGSSMDIRILASCMHAGARIVRVRHARDSGWTCYVLARFEEHKSMNYGSDFARRTDSDVLRCVSTSFYDKLLCMWDYESHHDAEKDERG